MSCLYSYSGDHQHSFAHLPEATKRYLFTTALLLCPGYSLLAEDQQNIFLDAVKVYEEDGIYHISLSSEIDASPKHVRDVITDYIHIYRLSDSITESRVTLSKDGRIEVETQVLCCVPVFCKEVTRVEEVRELQSGEIQTSIIPGKSDFKSGSTSWHIEPGDSRTRLRYEARLEPDFYIPPLLAKDMIIENMQQEFSTTVYRIQHIARINEDREWNDGYKFASANDDAMETPCPSTVSSIE